MRLRASGVCHSDWNAVDGTAETRCPAVLGHEGAGVVEAVGRACGARSGRRPCRALVGAVVRRVRRVPARPPAALLDGLAGDGNGRADGRNATAVPERRARLPLLLPLDLRGGVRRARALVHPHPRRRALRRRRARGLRGNHGVGAVWRTAGVRPGERVAVVGCGGVGLSALLARGGRGCGSGDRGRRCTGQARRRARARRDRRRSLAGKRRRRRRPRCARPPAEASTTRSRRRAGRRRWRPRSSRRARAERQCSSAFRARTPCCPCRRDDPANGAARARVDLRLVEARARLPAHARRCIAAGDFRSTSSCRIDSRSRRPSTAFELMQSGEALRVVLEL